MTAPAPAATPGSDLRWQSAVLPGVSRTFALTIPQLPAGLREVVGNAYLLCRITDTIEDEPALSAAEKQAFAERFVAVVAGREDAEPLARELGALLSPATTDDERALIAGAGRVIRITHGFGRSQREALARCVRIMAGGMAEFQLQASRDGLRDLAALDRYCYHVAGVVGEMLTELFCQHSAEIDAQRDALLPLAVSFGQGLQMTNILKDIWEDHRRGACWLPRDVFDEVGFDLRALTAERHDPRFAEGLLRLVGIARGHLANALRYTERIPVRETGIRRHCLWALGMAVLTLRRIHATPGFRSGAEVKIPRRSVRAVTLISSGAAHSNHALTWLFRTLTRSLPAVLLAAGLAACGGGPPPDAPPLADTIFTGGAIVTMDPTQPRVEAVAVRGETIAAAGAERDVLALRGDATRMVALGDRALLPGFIDAHGHFLATARTLDLLSLHPPPVGDVRTIDDIVRKLGAWIAERDIPPGNLVEAVGYDDSLLAEGRHPTRDDLDRASTDHRIVLLHVSGHLRAANSAALAAAGVTAATPDPPGGHIRRRPGSREPNGVLEEQAGPLVAAQLFQSTPAEADALARRAIDVYLRHGTTTVQDGGGEPGRLAALRAAAEREPFRADVAAFRTFRAMPDAERAAYEPAYRDGFRVAGVKFLLDGSPQGRTAWLTEPYTEGPPGAPADYRAYGTLDSDLYKAGAAHLLQRGVPILVHANGDAAIDLMLDGVAEAAAGAEGGLADRRPVIIHAQLMRADQLDRAAALGAVPSFFAAHAFFWGDWHLRSFGERRGSNVSPARWALDRGVRFTLHNDAPIVPPHVLRLVSIAVNRTTRSGRLLGPDQRLTVQEALHAVTLGAAYQYFEEDAKGSITPGKQADLVVLEQNPLTADPADLEHIRVLETFSRGRSVYSLAGG